MDSDIVGSILLQVVLIAVNAVFACAEIAVVSCNDAKLEKMAQEGNKRAAKLFHLTEQLQHFPAVRLVSVSSLCPVFSEVPLQQKIFRIESFLLLWTRV